jgi:hypothetical protein
MQRSFWRGWTALILAVGVLGGGPGSPVLDAFIYHGAGSPQQPSVPHLRAQGASFGHSDNCRLGWLRAQPPAAPVVGEVVAVFAAGGALSTSHAALASLSPSFYPTPARAPPFRSA